jgi:transcription initiation factor TFIID subunit 6
MSIIQPSSIQAIAHSVDIPKLSDEAAKTLAPDVEYRLREVVQVGVQVVQVDMRPSQRALWCALMFVDRYKTL